MLEEIWEWLLQDYNILVQSVSAYSRKIRDGAFLECRDELNDGFIDNIISAHIINLLLDNEGLYVPNKEILLSILKKSEFRSNIDWDSFKNGYGLKCVNDKTGTIENLMKACFDCSGRNFIQEVCAQDIVYGGEVAKKIEAFLYKVSNGIEIEIKGEEEFFRKLSVRRTKGGSVYRTKIQQKFEREYRNRGALIRNRVFNHKYMGKKISKYVTIEDENDEALNYKIDGNFCQSALLHVGIESTGSSGTGFLISKDGYALTCAHVVEGAKEIYATLINGDGYPIRDLEGEEVYGAGDGEVVYTNETLDIALIKMNHYGSGFLSIEQRQILPELGEEVVVFGYPLGYEVPKSNFFGPNISFYKGYVSSNQVMNGNSITFLDIDVKSGNSGSPVISTKTGKVIGIISGIKVGGHIRLGEKMPYMIPIQHFLQLRKQ